MSVSLIITACDRIDLLEKTLKSFIEFNTYPIEELIIRDDCGLECVWEDTKELLDSLFLPFPYRLLPPAQIGQIKSIDLLMNEVKTPYVFHCEDDWEFYKAGFIEKSLTLMENNDILTVWIRPKSDNVATKASSEIYLYKDIEYRLVIPSGDLLGFSFNPHLFRMIDYTNFEAIGVTNCRENAIGKYYSSKKTAWLVEGYCRHIGGDKSTLRPETPYREGVIKA